MLFRSVLLVAILSCVAYAQQDKTITIGARESGDRKVARNTFTISNPELGPFKMSGPLDSYRTINAHTSKITEMTIVAESNGCATVVPLNGGPGSSFVVLRFLAPAGCDLTSVNVDIYGL